MPIKVGIAFSTKATAKNSNMREGVENRESQKTCRK
jgi:hypothetical protein